MEKLEKASAIRKLRQEEEKLGSLTAEVAQLEEALEATAILETAGSLLNDISSQFAVLKVYVSLLGTPSDKRPTGTSDQSSKDSAALQLLSDTASLLQSQLRDFTKEKTLILKEKLEYSTTIHNAQSMKISKANQIVDIHTSIIDSHEHGALNIVNRLPRDILLEIFKYLDKDRKDSWELSVPAKERLFLPVSQVCWYWRDISLAMGKAFYCRDIGDRPAVACDMMEAQLQARGYAQGTKLQRNAILYIDTAAEFSGYLRRSTLGKYYDNIDHISHATIHFSTYLINNLPRATDLHLIKHGPQSHIVLTPILLKHVTSLRCTTFLPTLAPSSTLRRFDLDGWDEETPRVLVILMSSLQLFTCLESLRILCAPGSETFVETQPSLVVKALHLKSLALSSELAKQVSRLLSQGCLALPGLNRLEWVFGEFGWNTALCPTSVVHLQVRSICTDDTFPDEYFPKVLPKYEKLDILEIDGEHIDGVLTFLLKTIKTSEPLVQPFKTFIIYDWSGDGNCVLEYVRARNGNVPEKDKLKTVRFENCPDVLGYMIAKIQEYCDCQWDPSSVRVNGWTTR